MRHGWLAALAALLLGTGGGAPAAEIDFTAGLGTPVLAAGKAQSTFLKVSLKGFEFADRAKRPPANVAIVLDKSGSMAGDKLHNAKQAAADIVGRLNRDDIVSVVAYDDTVDVLVPSTRVLDKALIVERIERIRAGGQTALYAGVSKGAQEVRRSLERAFVNRVILLSDGLANVGPSSPHALGQLGQALGREGISVTTVGLGTGYNEDLMQALSSTSDGNHAFVEHPRDLARIFNLELADVTSVVAQDVDVTIRLAPGVRALQVLGRDADVSGRIVRTRLNQLHGSQEKYLLVEVEVPAGSERDRLKVADVDVSYLNMASHARSALSRAVVASFSESKELVARATDRKVTAAAVEQVSNALRGKAIELRDRGQVEEAKKTLEQNADYLGKNAKDLGDDALKKLERDARADADRLNKPADWNSQRKDMTDKNYRSRRQQTY